MLRKIALFTAFIACLITVWLAGMHKGYELGGTIRIFHSVYDFFVQCYSQIILLLLIYIFGKLIEKESLIISQLICFTSLILTVFPYRWIYLEKTYKFSDAETTTDVLIETLPFDQTAFFLVMVLMILQIAGVSKFLYEKYQSKPE